MKRTDGWTVVKWLAGFAANVVGALLWLHHRYVTINFDVVCDVLAFTIVPVLAGSIIALTLIQSKMGKEQTARTPVRETLQETTPRPPPRIVDTELIDEVPRRA